MNRKIMIDGVDRLGKSTLINGLLNSLGYHLVIHYDKPKALAFHHSFPYPNEKSALKEYQVSCNKNMFSLMKSGVPIIFDRTHLGEMVYAPLYRNYTGDYVFDLESNFLTSIKDDKATVLILLTTSNFDILNDDGLSFDFTKKEEEQKMFIEAFNRSKLPKMMVDVHDGFGGYKDELDILDEVLSKIG